MTRTIHPRNFTHEEDFVAARMDAAAAALPRVTDYDDFTTATRKRAAIAQAREDAREDARDDYAAWLEHVSERYDRGIGGAWA